MTESTDICFRVTAGCSRLQAVGNQSFFEALEHNHTSRGWLKHGFYGFLWFSMVLMGFIHGFRLFFEAWAYLDTEIMVGQSVAHNQQPIPGDLEASSWL